MVADLKYGLGLEIDEPTFWHELACGYRTALVFKRGLGIALLQAILHMQKTRQHDKQGKSCLYQVPAENTYASIQTKNRPLDPILFLRF